VNALQTLTDSGHEKVVHWEASKQEKADIADEYFSQVLLATEALIILRNFSAVAGSRVLVASLSLSAVAGSIKFCRGKRVALEYLSNLAAPTPGHAMAIYRENLGGEWTGVGVAMKLYEPQSTFVQIQLHGTITPINTGTVLRT